MFLVCLAFFFFKDTAQTHTYIPKPHDRMTTCNSPSQIKKFKFSSVTGCDMFLKIYIFNTSRIHLRQSVQEAHICALKAKHPLILFGVRPPPCQATNQTIALSWILGRSIHVLTEHILHIAYAEACKTCSWKYVDTIHIYHTLNSMNLEASDKQISYKLTAIV